jgi:hypothetical protein
MWSGNLHRVYTSRRTIAAENKRDADQKSATHPAELDSGLSSCSGGRVGRRNYDQRPSASTSENLPDLRSASVLEFMFIDRA